MSNLRASLHRMRSWDRKKANKYGTLHPSGQIRAQRRGHWRSSDDAFEALIRGLRKSPGVVVKPDPPRYPWEGDE